nr:ceramide synthase 6 [Parasacculina yatsui]
MLLKLSNWFWNENFWLPPNVTWRILDERRSESFAQFSDLVHPFPMAFFFLLIRFFVEKFWWAPLGRMRGLRAAKTKRPLPVKQLETAYLKSRRWTHKQISQFAEELQMTERQVDRWLRLRKLQDSPDKLTRFTETGWQFSYYLFIFCFGLKVMWNKSWFWDIRYCFYDLPFHPVDNDVWWYYMLSLAFYWSMLFRHFFDVKHKDFWEMFIHHVVTVGLLTLSWSCNFTRIGTLVLLVHDVSDIFLLGAKMLKYASLQTLCDITFAVFVVIWIVTRLVIFPFWIVYSTSYDATFIVRMFPAYYVFNGLLICLLVLHCIWTYYIMLVAYRALLAGQMSGDSRSDSSADEVSSNEASDNDHTGHLAAESVTTSYGDQTSDGATVTRRVKSTN